MIKQSVRELHDDKGAHGVGMSQGLHLYRRVCIAMGINMEVTIPITVHDNMSKLRQKGAGSRQLRYKV